MMKQLEPLLEKLRSTHFAGKLILRFELGMPIAAELHHYLARDNFDRPLPVIEPDTPASAKP
jgi:hypothetical protein